MSRRVLNDDGFAHVISRGVGKMIIFEEEADYKTFISLMMKYSEEAGITIIAYCLMINHVHMLVRYGGDNISEFMKNLCSKYATYFNSKYERVGHLFQNRYKMENVEDESYFLTVLRYILQNPEKASICKTGEYRWSSLWKADTINRFVDVSIPVSMLGGYEKFYRFVTSSNDEACMDDYDEEEEGEENDLQIVSKARRALGINNLSEIKMYKKEERNKILRKMRDEGFTIKQIERLTGVGRGVIQRV